MNTTRSPAPSMHEGEILAGKFRVERVLGVGGMGVVLAATHLALNQLVALKFVLPGQAPSPEALQRFQREARAAVRLKSEHVARILDVGELPGVGGGPGAPYIVMEYLEGHDLESYAHGLGGKLPVREAVDYVLQACEAIAEAHALGIVHRDLKPKNLFLTSRVDGRPLVKVLDFGISKVVTPAPQENMSLTKTSDVIGSPRYMSPEQLRSARDVDARTDVWSLGVILYELLTGTVPFPADHVAALAAMILESRPVPLRSIRIDAPTALELIVMHCLEKDRAKRFQTVGDLARVLQQFASPLSDGAADRIAQVEASRGSGPPAYASEPRPHFAVTGDTSGSSWGDTVLAAKGKLRSPLVIGIALLLAAALGVAWWALGRAPASQAHEAVTPGASASPSTSPSPTPDLAPPSNVAPPPASIAPSPSAPPSSAHPPLPASASPHPKARASAAPSASAAPGEDLPSERH